MPSFKYLSLITICISSLLACNGQSEVAGTNSSEVQPLSDDTKVEMSDNINRVFQDKDGRHWFASMQDGLYLDDGTSIKHFGPEDGLETKRIDGILQHANGELIFKTADGVFKFENDTFTKLDVIKVDDSEQGWELTENDLWMGWDWEHDGPYRYDGEKLYLLTFPKHPLHDDYYSSTTVTNSPYIIYTIEKDRDGNVWFGTAGFGACRYNGKSFDWIYEEELTELDDGPAPGVRAIVHDQNGDFWFSNNIIHRYTISGSGEAFTYDIKTGIDTADHFGLPTYYNCIMQASNGDMWMVTYQSGVWRYDGNTTYHYLVEEAGQTLSTYTIDEDGGGTIWLGTFDGGAYTFDGQQFVPFLP